MFSVEFLVRKRGKISEKKLSPEKIRSVKGGTLKTYERHVVGFKVKYHVTGEFPEKFYRDIKSFIRLSLTLKLTTHPI